MVVSTIPNTVHARALKQTVLIPNPTQRPRQWYDKVDLMYDRVDLWANAAAHALSRAKNTEIRAYSYRERARISLERYALTGKEKFLNRTRKYHASALNEYFEALNNAKKEHNAPQIFALQLEIAKTYLEADYKALDEERTTNAFYNAIKQAPSDEERLATCKEAAGLFAAKAVEVAALAAGVPQPNLADKKELRTLSGYLYEIAGYMASFDDKFALEPSIALGFYVSALEQYGKIGNASIEVDRVYGFIKKLEEPALAHIGLSHGAAIAALEQAHNTAAAALKQARENELDALRAGMNRAHDIFALG